MIAIGVKMTWIPRSARNPPIRELGPYSATSITPVTRVGIARGRSTIAESARLPRNEYRTRTYASIVPITALINAAKVDVIRVRRIAAMPPGTSSAVRIPVSPSPKPFVTTAATGNATIAPR